MRNRYSTEQFFTAASESFPQLRQQFADERECAHAKGVIFADFLNHRIAAGDEDAVKRAIDLIEKFHPHADADLNSVFHCDFFVKLELGFVSGQEMYNLLSPSVQKAYDKAQEKAEMRSSQED